MEKKKRIYYWDNLKGLLMLLVVFGHFVETYGGYFSHKNLIWTAVYSFHMPAFALVSGYFIRRSSKDPIEKVPKAAGLYLMMMLLYTIRPFLYGKGFSMELASPKYGLWYLLFLVYAYVLTHFLNRKNEILILAGTVLAGMLAGFDSSVGRAWGIGQSIYIMPYLIIGACMDVDRIAVFARRHKKTAWTGFFLVQFLIVFLQKKTDWFDRRFFRGMETFAETGGKSIYGMLGRGMAYVLAVILIVCLLGMISQKKCVWSDIGKHTLLIYLVHTFMIKNIQPELGRLPFPNWETEAVVLLVLIGIGCLLVLKISRMAETMVSERNRE